MKLEEKGMTYTMDKEERVRIEKLVSLIECEKIWNVMMMTLPITLTLIKVHVSSSDLHYEAMSMTCVITLLIRFFSENFRDSTSSFDLHALIFCFTTSNCKIKHKTKNINNTI